MIPPWVGAVLVVAAFLGCFLFVATYASRRWWADEIGRNTMAFAACETAILGLMVAGLAGEVPGREWAAHLLFAALAAVAWWRWVALLRARTKRSNSEGNGNA